LVERPEPKNLQKAEYSNDITPSQLLQMAVANGAEPDRLEKLMDLHIKWEANLARKAYVAAMTKFREKCPTINKSKDVGFDTKGGGRTSYKYAPLAATIDAIKSLMSECGLSHSWRLAQTDGIISVTCQVTHIDGHREETTMSGPSDGSGGKNAIQQIASTVSYLERYTLFAMLGLASQDMDDDGGSGDGNGKTSQQKLIEKLIIESYEKLAELSKPSLIDFELYKGELRKLFKNLPPDQKRSFKWTAEEVEELSGRINVNNVIKKG